MGQQNKAFKIPVRVKSLINRSYEQRQNIRLQFTKEPTYPQLPVKLMSIIGCTMTDTKNLKEIRRLIAAFVADFGRGEALDSQILIDQFIRNNLSSVRSAQDALTRIALRKLLGDVERRTLRVIDDSFGTDLFGRYSVPSVAVFPSPSSAGPRRVHRHVEDMTMQELEMWFEWKSSPRRRNNTDLEEIGRLIEHVRPFMTGNMTLLQGMRAAYDHKD